MVEEPIEVLREEEPLSRESLYQEKVVQALWEAAKEHPQIGAASPRECAIVFRNFAHTNTHEYEIRTALDYYNVTNVSVKRISRAFRTELENNYAR